MYRNSSYDEDLSKELLNSEFAQGFLLTLMEGEEGLSLAAALRHTIERMGVKELCTKAKMRMQNVNDFIKGRRKPKPDSLDAFLKPFGLRTRIVVEKAS